MKNLLVMLGLTLIFAIGCGDKKSSDGDKESASGSGVKSGGANGGGGGSESSIEVGTGPAFADITKTGFTVSWTAATSTGTAQDQLEYQLVMARSADALATLADAEAVDAADVLLPYTVGVLSHQVTDLSPSETYYFAVLVRDQSGKTALYPAVSVTTLALNAPTPGAAITFGLITSTSFSIYWGEATSTVAQQEELQYRVVIASDASSISTIAGAEAVTGSDVVLDWTADRSGATYIPSGDVQGSKTYAVAVLVKDPKGVKAIYTPQTVTTLPHKLIFATANLYDPSTLGISGSDIQADTYCNNEKPAGRGTFKAMITIPTVREACRTHADCKLGSTLLTNDGIGWVMAPETPYENERGELLWTTNAAGIVSRSSNTPGAISNSSVKAWTGLNADWTRGANCDNWTSSDSGDRGLYGFASLQSASAWSMSDYGCNGWAQAGGGYIFASIYCVEQ